MSRILRLVLCSLEVIADEVPESIADEGVKVEQVDDVGKLFLHLSISVQEVYACNYIFLLAHEYKVS